MKNFLKNKNTVTILGVIACLVILYAGYTMRINKKTALVDVYYANQTIQPKTKITDEMVSKTSVPTSFILGDYYRDYNEIVGKYSNYNTMIAEGSLFYISLLTDEENLPDAILYNINEGERLVSHPVDIMSTYGNSIMPGNIVDIYVKIITEQDKVIYGQLMDQIEVLGVKDGSGKNVFETTDEERSPSFVYFALPEAKYLTYSALNYIAEYYEDSAIEIVIVPNTFEFDAENPLAVEVTSDYLYKFILDRIEKIDNQKELYNELLNEMEQQELEKKQKAQDKKDNKDDKDNKNQ